MGIQVSGRGWIGAGLLLAAVFSPAVFAQEQNVAPADPAAAEYTLSDLPEDFPLPEGSSVESGRMRGRHRTFVLGVPAESFAELVRFFEQQLPEKNFRIMGHTPKLDLDGVDQAASFTVRARTGAVFGLLVLQKGEAFEVVLEGLFVRVKRDQ